MDVTFRLGPVASDAALAWLASGRAIVAAMVGRPAGVPFIIEPPLLELIDTYFSIWSSAAASADPLRWETTVDSSVIAVIAVQWRRIAAMDGDDVAALGCTWPPPEALPFHEALLEAATTALDQDPKTADLAADLRARPPGTPADQLGGWEAFT